MDNETLPPEDLLKEFDASVPVHVATTSLATVWKVMWQGTTPAALKLYHSGDMRNETHGFSMLQFWAGNGAARLYHRNRHAALLEWLDGPSLGDVARQGQDVLACTQLVEVARRLHSATLDPIPKLPELSSWFTALLDAQVSSGCPEVFRRDLEKARGFAIKLLESQTDIACLHGDLHHDNVRLTGRGYCAFDAKGVLGDRAYELANSFRNPTGMPKAVRDTARIHRLLSLYETSFGVARLPMARWAAAKCALSIAWKADGNIENDPEQDLLAILVRVVEDFE